MTRRIFFSVSGDGSFPFRMLAIDECWPATEPEAEKITLACPTVASRQTITLVSERHPTVAKWETAKWPIMAVW